MNLPTCCTRSSQSKAATQPKRQGSWVPRDVLLRCFTCDIDNYQNLNGQYLLWILDTYDLWISMDNWGIVILELLYIYIHKHVYHIMFPVFTMATHEWTLAENQLCFFLVVNYDWNLCVRANFWWVTMENEIIIHCMFFTGNITRDFFPLGFNGLMDNDGGLSMMGWR